MDRRSRPWFRIGVNERETPLLAARPESRLSQSGHPMIGARALVSVVDDDESPGESLPTMLGELGLAAREFCR